MTPTPTWFGPCMQWKVIAYSRPNMSGFPNRKRYDPINSCVHLTKFYLIKREIRFFSEPFDQIKKVRTFLMQNRPMANNIS